MKRTVIHVACAALLAAFSATLPANAAQDEDTRIQQGEALIQNGKFREAIDTLSSVVRENPQSGLGYTRLGGAYMMNGDYGSSIKAFQSAISIDPGNSSAFAALGVSYMHMGRYGPARAALEEAVKLDPAKKNAVTPLLQRIEERLANGDISPPQGH